MRQVIVEDLMIPLNEYSTVSENAALLDAIEALERAQKQSDKQMIPPHRAVLVCDKSKHVVGKVSQLDILRALESNSEDLKNLKAINKYGFSQKAIQSMIAEHNLWESLSERLTQKTMLMKVKDFMYTPKEGEFVEIKATINEAIHQLVVGHHQSLLVTSNKKICGILRLIDVFNEICNTTKLLEEAC